MEWYRLHRRDLPMRADDVSPWGTLVFEVMSQQTPIPRIQPIWERWMSLWPTPADLAKASPAEVLVEWSHLGYPSRALRLRDCALSITHDFGGVLPSTYEALLELPGIGPYTASAIASFQFHQRVPVLDTNIRRVFARICDGVEFARRSAPSRFEFAAAMEWLPEDGAECALWNVAIMEFGALVCTQRSPKCDDCPLREDCAWAEAGFPPAEVRPRGQAWKGTDRQARGRVMAALRASPSGISIDEAAAAARLEGADPQQAPRVIEALIRDGLVAEEVATRHITLPRE
ncbi:MAG: A/G-specific adenine glycosylase [Actinomyces sp.]|nr:A/G-specific adenine glycosylase [Actinomyces sp.]